MSTAEKGFSLLELLIVVGIILVIATLATPTLMRSRQVANESAAVADLKLINTAEVTYLLSSSGNYGNLSQMVSAGLLDTRFASGKISGYNFSVSASSYDYTVTADPVSTGSGRYGFYSTPDAVIRYSMNLNAAPIGQSGFPVN